MAFLQIGFALHQEPRDKRFREKIVAPVGYTIVEADAMGQEFRWMAELSGDEVMRQLCLPGEDAHSYMGAHINREWEYRALVAAIKADNDKDARNLRYTGKFANLSCQYRVSAIKLLSVGRVQYGLDLIQSQADKIHAAYRLAYPDVPRYWNSQISKTQKLGYVETLAGRRVEVKGDWSRGSKLKWNMQSTAINFPIQGVGAEQKYLALACLKNRLSEFESHFFMDLHDGLYFLVPDDRVGEFIATIQAILDDLPYRAAWGYTPSIPMPWEIKAGPSWGQLKEWK